MGGPDLLAGRRVLEFSTAAAGPTGGMLLALAGADVVRVESRGALDPYRAHSVATKGHPDGSVMFASVNLGKRSVLLDLRHPEGAEIALRLAATSDVVIDSLAPGALRRRGLGFTQLRERRSDIVMVSASAAGQTGPKSTFRGYAPNFGAMSGLSAAATPRGGRPTLFGRSLDSRVGTAIALAAVTGLIAASGGEAVHVDLSDQEVAAGLIGDLLSAAASGADLSSVFANEEPGQPGTGLYTCADGRHVWVEDTGGALDGVVPGGAEGLMAWAAGTTSDDALRTLTTAGVPATLARTVPELLPGDGSSRWYRHTANPQVGPFAAFGLPFRVGADVPAAAGPAPGLGEHTAEVLAERLGLPESEIDRLVSEGVCR